MFKSLLLSAVFSLPIFSDGFEANASTCWSGVKSVDTVNDALAPVLVKSGALVCLDKTVVKFDCQLVNGQCKRDEPVIPPPVGGCSIKDPLIAPAGMAAHRVTWPKLMLGAEFPYGNSYLSPTGSYTLRTGTSQGPTMTGKWIEVEFVAEANKLYNIYWLGIQRQAAVPGYRQARPARSVLISVSPCAGDLRPPNTFSPDPFLSKCRALRAESTLAFGAKSNTACKLNAGQKYYLNIAFVDPNDGITPGETTCDSPAGFCEVNLNAPQKP